MMKTSIRDKWKQEGREECMKMKTDKYVEETRGERETSGEAKEEEEEEEGGARKKKRNKYGQ